MTPTLPSGWARTTVGDLADVVPGGTPSTREPAFWGGDVPWFTPAEISSAGSGVVRRSARRLTEAGLAASGARLLPVGSLLVTSRASIGNCAILGVQAATNQGFTSLVPRDEASTLFLYYWVQANRNEFLSRAAGSTFLEISARKVAAIPVVAPPLNERACIGRALADADAEIAAIERLIEKTRLIKQGMMQELLSGRTRLPASAEAAA